MNLEDRADLLIEQIKTHKEKFKIPNRYVGGNYYFPDYVENLLKDYRIFYKDIFNDLIDEHVPFENNKKNVVLERIDCLTDSILETINIYYEGKPFEANDTFIKGLKKNLINKIHLPTTMNEGKSFYRARVQDGVNFTCKDLFHIDFSLRNMVSTNRYSIPGIPALYLADSSYTCWEEFNRPNIKNLWFMKLINVKCINVIEILLVKDFLKSIEKLNGEDKIYKVLSYLAYFPISIASTIKVVQRNAPFKPEYIIPQMLLEYTISEKIIDGIRFPSTQLNYDQLNEIEAYNYIFPVKTTAKMGLCNELINMFKVTVPTSLELEELLDNPPVPTNYVIGEPENPSQKISLFDNDERMYYNTSFGKIEYILKNKSMNFLNS